MVVLAMNMLMWVSCMYCSSHILLHSVGGDSLILAAAFFYSVVPLLALLSQAAAATALSAPEATCEQLLSCC